ncbi:MAG TPA: glycosyltransferase [Vicinamibacteria bacterium]|nr:glycosyltransferase [Vicinamibacteria bacterium]
MRGGEKVLVSLARLFPDATLFTLLHVKGSVAPELERLEVRTSFLQHAPGVRHRYRQYLPLFPLAVESFDLRGFDLVLSSSHCVAKGVRPGPGAVHLCYCHTPMRYVWDRYDDYFGPGRLGPLGRLLIPPICAGLRGWDTASSARVHRFAANSAYVADRIRRYYGRDAVVVPPPVDCDFFTPPQDCRPGEYDLIVSALAPYKRLDLALEAYRGTGRPLWVVGSGPEEPRLRAVAPPEALFLGRVDDVRLRELYRRCRAVLMPGIEDFGIVPLEAMACGRPAVVFAEGGGAETVEHGRTGLVFHEARPQALRDAVAMLDGIGFDRLALRARAEAHRRQVFEARIRAFVSGALCHGDAGC